MLKRFLASMLAFCILFGAVPAPTSYADEGEQPAIEEQLPENSEGGELPPEPSQEPVPTEEDAAVHSCEAELEEVMLSDESYAWYCLECNGIFDDDMQPIENAQLMQSVFAVGLPASGTCGSGVTWELDSSGLLTISGNGYMNSYSNSDPDYADYSDDITKIVVKSGVSNIGSYAFANLWNVTEVVLEEGVSTIGREAFFRCSSLKKITLPLSLSSVGAMAFYDCAALKNVSYAGTADFRNMIEVSGTSELSSATWKYTATAGGTCGADLKWCLCADGTLVIVGSGSMEDYSYTSSSPFYAYRDQITAVVLPDGITTIGEYAFAPSFSKLAYITVPTSVTHIKEFAFGNSYGKVQLKYPGTMAQWNKISITSLSSYSIQYGAECSDGTIIYKGNCGTYGSWPDVQYALMSDGTLKLTGSGTMNFYKDLSNASHFSDDAKILKVEIADGISNIAGYAFKNCTNLKEVHIPVSVKNISYNVFDGCSSLTDIYYGGSEADWNKVSISESGNSQLANVTVHYTDPCESGHSWDEGEVTTAPTCGEDGIRTYTCSVCGGTKTGAEPKHENHTWNEGEVTTEPSCKEDGIRTYTCSVCGGTKSGAEPKHENHTWNDGEVTTEATCQEDGVKTYTCTVCSASYEDDYSDPDAHSYEQNKCIYCQEWEVLGEGTCGENLNWILLGDGVLTITGSGAMDDYAYNCAPWYDLRSNIKSVVISEGLTAIGKYAFYDCYSIENVYISDLAAWCAIEFEDYYANPLYFAETLYLNGEEVTELVIPETVTSIGQYAFYRFDNLKHITFLHDSDDELSIGKYAFYTDYTVATTINVPDMANMNPAIGEYDWYYNDNRRVSFGASGDVTWYIEDGVLNINGSGELTSNPWSYFRNDIEVINIGAGITKLQGSYSDYTNLKEIHFFGTTMPELNGWRLDVPEATILYYPEANSLWLTKINEHPNYEMKWHLEGSTDAGDSLLKTIATYQGNETISICLNEDVEISGDIIIPQKIRVVIRPAIKFNVLGNIQVYGTLHGYYDSSDNGIDYEIAAKDIVVYGGLVVGQYGSLDAENVTVNGEFSNNGSTEVDNLVVNGDLYTSSGTVSTETFRYGSNAWIGLYGGKLDVSGTVTAPSNKLITVNANQDESYYELSNAVSENLYPYVDYSGLKLASYEELAAAMAMPVGRLSAYIDGDITLADDLTIPKNFSITINENYVAGQAEAVGSVIVPAGVKLTNNGQITLYGRVDVADGAAFRNNGIIDLAGGYVEASGLANISYGTSANFYYYNGYNYPEAKYLQNFVRCGLTHLYFDEDYVIDADIELPQGGSFNVSEGVEVVIAENASLVINYDSKYGYSIPQVSGSLIINGSYDGPDIHVFLADGGYVGPDDRVQTIRNDGIYKIVNTKKLKATSLKLLDAFGQPITSGSKINVEMTEQPSYDLGVSIAPAGASKVVGWKSGSTAIATVDAGGNVRFHKPGTVTITATTKDGSGKSASVTFNVSFKGFTASEKFTAAMGAESLTFLQNTKIGLQMGDSAAIMLYGNDKTTPLDPELFVYGSNNVGVKVENGIVTAEKAGISATVTAALKDDPLGRKVSITVKTIQPQVRTVSILPGEDSAVFHGIDANGDFSAESGLEPVSYAIYLDKGDAQTVNIKASAIGPDGNEMSSTKGVFTWASSATGVATVKENADGTVTITTKKNVDGACTISAVSKDTAKATGYIAVYVMDKTPRLAATSLTLDSQKANRTELALVESYGNEILGVQFNDVYNSKTKVYESSSGKFNVSYDAEKELLVISANSWLKNQTVKGQLLVQTENGEYRLNLSVVIKNTAPSVTMKQPAKFNLFYKDSSAELFFTVKNETISNVELAEGDFKGSWDGEKLTISYASENPPAKPNTKLTVKLHLEGYAYPVEKAYTLGTVTTKPSLKLGVSSATVNPNMGDTVLPVQVYDNTAKDYMELSAVSVLRSYNQQIGMYHTEIRDNFIHLYMSVAEMTLMKSGKHNFEIQHANWTAPITVSFTLNINKTVPVLKPAATTLTVNKLLPSTEASTAYTLGQNNADNAFVVGTEIACVKPTVESDKLRVWLEGGEIHAKILDSSIKPGSYSYSFKPIYSDGNVNLELKEVKFTVKVVNTLPVAKLSKTSLSLNHTFTLVSDMTTVVASGTAMGEYAIVDVVPKTTGSEVSKIGFEIDGANLVAKVSDGNAPKAGSYSFLAKVVCRNNGDEVALKDLALTVKVVNTLPKVSLSASTISLNTASGVAGREVIGVNVKTSTVGYSIVGVRFERADTSASLLGESEKIFAGAVSENQINFALNQENLPKTGSYKYMIYYTVRDDATGQAKEFSNAPLSLTVKPYSNAKYSATVSASGKLDAVVADSAITYTLTKLNYVVGNVAEVQLVGADAELFKLEQAEPNAKGQAVVKLKMKEGVEYSTKLTYKLQLKYILEGGIEVMSSALSVKVSSSTIKLKANPATQSFYQSQSRTRVVRYTVDLTGPAGAKIGEVKLGNVGLLQRSLVNENTNVSINITSDGKTAVVYVTLKDTSALAANKTYTLPLEVKAAGQATGTAAAKINLSLKLLK